MTEMTELMTTIRPSSRTAAGPSPAPIAESAAQEPTLITEQQVLINTAAAVAMPPAKTRRWTDTVGSVTGAVHTWFAEALKPPRPRNTKRYDFLEDARMAREMHRL